MKRRRCARPCFPRSEEFVVACARRQRQVELRPRGRVAAGLAHVAGAGIQESPVLVDVDHDQVRIGLVRVVDAVAVVHVDVNVADAPDAEARAQAVDDDAEVVEHAEARRAAPPGVMQPPDRLEAAHRVAGHDPLQALERGAGDHRAAVVDAGECRRVAVVQIALADRRAQLHPAHVLGGVEALELGARSPGAASRSRPACRGRDRSPPRGTRPGGRSPADGRPESRTFRAARPRATVFPPPSGNPRGTLQKGPPPLLRIPNPGAKPRQAEVSQRSGPSPRQRAHPVANYGPEQHRQRR